LEIFRNAAATVGDDARFGVPRLPEGHRPRVSPREALTALWPAAVKVLSREYGPAGKAERVSPGHWPTVVAMTAQKLIVRSKGALDPTLSMRIVLEAAVPMSKVDPKTVPRG
jgi:hypothetical protein